MAIGLDKALGIHAQALQVRAQRAEMLASNLANAETPGYKARDIDFRQALAGAQQNIVKPATSANTVSAMNQTHQSHIAGNAITSSSSSLEDAFMRYRLVDQPSLDGNTVDPHKEKMQFTENAMQYQTSLQLLSGKISGLRRAIKGE
ncbi:flagellar basal body rod protein FlgB [Pelagibaculum spongiae]|uniref:Flagellar basal body rod protein FlgB n=1 Tax=Pelagibaculum spongiae TaxID=2080658 RepID=A0A2V1GT10_9GAMM|nr:flagellar basal body rod protein FlgB [Pelagibaculum spongiae]PVZ66747.1 flagellar basal body rod protein FlgB [Pelagibaculum spongiae]